jgi:hypothetical protein
MQESHLSINDIHFISISKGFYSGSAAIYIVGDALVPVKIFRLRG